MPKRQVLKIPEYIPPRIEDYGLSQSDIDLILLKKGEIEKLKNSNSAFVHLMFYPVVFCVCLYSWFQEYAFGQSLKIIGISIGIWFLVLLGEFSIFLIKSYRSDSINEKYQNIFKSYDRYQEDLRVSKQSHSEMVRKIRQQEKEFWYSLDGIAFEKEIANLFRNAGFRVELTPRTRDMGIDLNLYNDKTRTIVQCKAHKKPVGPKEVRELYGVLMSNDDAYDALLVTTNGATSGAHAFVKGKPINIWDIDDILRYVSKFG